MSREEPSTSAIVSPFATETRPALPHSRASSYLHSLHKPESSASAPSDSNWVSPFTLAPLQVFQRSRGQQTVLKSPESRRRSNSSLFYAAAWGSPYATPSPKQSPASGHSTGKSLDLTRPSPPRFGSDWIQSISAKGASVAQYLYSPEKSVVQVPLVSRSRSHSPGKDRSERENWLSDSDSDVEAKGEDLVKTPTRTLFSKLRAGSFGKAIGHRVRESNSTVTPENFNAPVLTPQELKSLTTTELSNMAALGEMNESYSGFGSPGKEKPLPLLPRRMSSLAKIETSVSPTSPSRPRLPSVQALTRPKKQVLWKGKKCIIALPLQDREEAGLPPPLSPKEVKERLRTWEVQGFDTGGFILGDSIAGDSVRGSGHSRSVYPDPTDLSQERQQRKFNISIPNQAEWDAWVDYLKEEKLRALGVTSSNSEAPASTRSPFSASLSRTSSVYPGHALSPPNAPSSVASNPARLGSNPFSPHFNPSTGVSSQSASIASPLGYPPAPGPMHRYNKSVAQPMQGRMVSPFDSMAPGVNSPPSYFMPRQGTMSPAVIGGLPNLGEVLSPVSPFGFDSSASSVQQHPGMEHLRRQQQELQSMHHQHQQSVQLNHQSQRSSLPMSSAPEAYTHPKLEIAHPTPRSHRHNLSEALQKGAEDTENLRDEKVSETQPRELVHSAPKQNGDGEPRDDEDEESLPILKRPDGLVDSDDIITNPSNEPSPLPRDETDPLADWKPATAADRLKSRVDPGKGHKIQPSMSKLNVQAKEFDPRAAFTSSNFSFGGNSFQPFGTTAKQAIFGFGNDSQPLKPDEPEPRNKRPFNVEAPAFTPSSLSNLPQINTFGFTSTTFNVEAPEFNPSASVIENFKIDFGSGSDAPSPAAKIFGNIVIDPSLKASRRNTKALPVVRPRSKDGLEKAEEESQNEDSEFSAENEDEEGRPQAPAERQKRVRRRDSGGDYTPMYADSAPFNHRRILSEIVDEAERITQTFQGASTPPIDGWGYVPAERSEVVNKRKIEVEDDEEADDGEESSGTNPWSPFVFKSDKEALESTDPELASPTALEVPGKQEEVRSIDTDQLADIEVDQPLAKMVEPIPQPKVEPTEHKPKTSLSALAKPFEFKPCTTNSLRQPVLVTTPTLDKRKSSGLLASRYAHSPSPPSSPILPSQDITSPPTEMYSYIRPDDDDKPVDIAKENEVSSAEQSRRETLQQENKQAVPGPDLSLETNDGSDSMSISGSADHTNEVGPSYEEIDAVMKQFQQNPDLGVERIDTPVQSLPNSTPLIDMRLHPNIRSDAPSPSPRRVQATKSQREDSTEVDRQSLLQDRELAIGVHKLTDGTGAVSDWNDTLSPEQEDKVQSRAQFFDGHVTDLVGGILEDRLGPMERTLQAVQHSITLIATAPRGAHRRRTRSNDIKVSDADDEDEYDAFEGFADYRTRSPAARKDRKSDRIRQAVLDALAAHPSVVQPSAPVDLSEVHAALAEMRQLAIQIPPPETRNAELKAIVEEVIGTHPRLKGQRVQQNHDFEEKFKLQINGLETMLKVSNDHAEEEARSRREVEVQLADTLRRLRNAEEEAAQHRESAEEAQRSYSTFIKERESYRDIEQTLSELGQKNAALESTLEEYRESRKSWQEDIRNLKEDLHEEHLRSQDLERTLQNARDQLHERSISREALRNTVDRLRGEMTNLAQHVASERSEWRESEHELSLRYRSVQAELDHERRRREKSEQDFDDLDREHKEHLKFTSSHERAQEEILGLKDLVATLREENKVHQDKTSNAERELAHLKENTATEVARAVAQLEINLERAKSRLANVETDAAAQIARLQARVDDAELDLEEQKAKNESILAETVDTHNQALQEASEKREAALQEQHETHERKLADLRDRHTRALHNSSDDRHRLEFHLNEKLKLSDDKNQHLESKVQDLEERLAIMKSAARAAVEAATAKGINLPTPAPSTVASPPHHPSLSFMKGSDIPEKISPQALRESIMVLQDQLLNREQAIEKLESELSEVDKDAPRKIQNLETEIGWLRELLTVRVDDIEDIINILSKPEFDRNSAKDAAIRLRANLQMEQQLKERAGSTSGLPASISLPSMASISSTLTQSPRALPMAAAAAWGNWRKARDSSFGALSDLATNLSTQTPSKSTVGSPGSFLGGIMTPPGTSLKSPPPPFGETSAPRPLAGSGPRKMSSEARPLRAYNSQPRALAKKKEKEVERRSSAQHRHPEAPVTPPLKSWVSPDENGDDERSMAFGEDVDDDASPLDGREARGFGLV